MEPSIDKVVARLTAARLQLADAEEARTRHQAARSKTRNPSVGRPAPIAWKD